MDKKQCEQAGGREGTSCRGRHKGRSRRDTHIYTLSLFNHTAQQGSGQHKLPVVNELKQLTLLFFREVAGIK